MNEELSRNLKTAYEICDGKVYNNTYNNYGNFSKIYPFTNENINGYIDNFNLNNKSLLTVGSSSDQVINAILKDCIDITLLDINPYAKYYFYLKKAALITLNREDYFNFFKFQNHHSFFKFNYDTFNKKTFNYLSSTLAKLDYESYLFWHGLLQYFDGYVIREELFSSDEKREEDIKKFNTYLNSDSNYLHTKEKIKSVTPKFINDDIFTCNINSSYDNIWLSSILPFIREYNLIKELTVKMINHLNSEGSLLISYLYNMNKYIDYESDWASIYNLKKVYSLLSDYSIDLVSFLGVNGIKTNNEDNEDSILLYRKR